MAGTLFLLVKYQKRCRLVTTHATNENTEKTFILAPKACQKDPKLNLTLAVLQL